MSISYLDKTSDSFSAASSQDNEKTLPPVPPCFPENAYPSSVVRSPSALFLILIASIPLLIDIFAYYFGIDQSSLGFLFFQIISIGSAVSISLCLWAFGTVVKQNDYAISSTTYSDSEIFTVSKWLSVIHLHSDHYICTEEESHLIGKIKRDSAISLLLKKTRQSLCEGIPVVIHVGEPCSEIKPCITLLPSYLNTTIPFFKNPILGAPAKDSFSARYGDSEIVVQIARLPNAPERIIIAAVQDDGSTEKEDYFIILIAFALCALKKPLNLRFFASDLCGWLSEKEIKSFKRDNSCEIPKDYHVYGKLTSLSAAQP